VHLIVMRVQYCAADGLADLRSTRLARNQAGNANNCQTLRQPPSLGGLARTFDAFEGYEDAAHQVRA